jgi:DNA (cytosine-5)-methyltransferase 1
MRVLDLFSGIGGFSLASHWAGMTTAAFCEIDPFCQKVLNKNFPGVPIYDDVRTVTKEQLEKDGVVSDTRGIDLVTGGIPCQSFSFAGKRRGKEDERYLWPEMFRITRELRPSWVLVENVTGFIDLALDDVLDDLESEGYATQSLILSAQAIGAPHRRERIWIVGYSNSKPKLQTNSSFGSIGSKWETWEVASRELGRTSPRTYWEENQSPVCGVDDGISGGLDKDRLKALGNTVVPQVVYPILKAIMGTA